MTYIHWISRYGILPLILIAFSSSKGIFPLFFLQAVIFAFSVMLIIPGGGGSIEAISVFILPYFISPSLIGVALVIWRFFAYYLSLLIGGVVFLWTENNFNQLFPKSIQA